MKTTKLFIQNLKCSACENQIRSKLEALPLGFLEVNVTDGFVSFGYEEDDALELAKSELKKMGYPSEGEFNSIIDKIKSYGSCMIGRTKKIK